MAKKTETKEEVGLSGSRLKKLTIRNFRCIGNEGVTIELDRIVVLVGPNNVGKSTILRAYQYVMDHKPITVEDLPNGKFDPENRPTIELETWLGDEKPGADWILVDESKEEYIREQWQWDEAFKPERKGWNRNTNSWAKEVPWGAPNIAKARRPKPHRVEAFASPKTQADSVAKLLVEWVKEKVPNPASDEDSENSSAFGKLRQMYKDVHKDIMSETKVRVEQAETAITSLVSKVFVGYKVKFEVSPSDNEDKFFDLLLTNPSILMGPDGGHMADVQNQGSGAQRTLLWAALKLLAEETKEKRGGKAKSTKNEEAEQDDKADQEARRPNVLLIDEPEICLHPTAVREACKSLYDLAEGNTNWQVMVTTHSPIFIDLSRDHTTVVRVQSDSTGKISGTTIFRPDKAELSKDEQENLKMLNLWDPYVAEFFFGGKTILVEGDTEYLAFKTIISEYPDDFKDVHIIRARGKAILVPLSKILNHFGQSYAILHDSDMPTIETKNGAQTNGMWTENQKIKDTALRSVAGARVVASVKDFEMAIFGEEKKKDKPYTMWKQLNESTEEKRVVRELLEALIDHSKPLPPGFIQWETLDKDLENAVNNKVKQTLAIGEK